MEGDRDVKINVDMAGNKKIQEGKKKSGSFEYCACASVHLGGLMVGEERGGEKGGGRAERSTCLPHIHTLFLTFHYNFLLQLKEVSLEQ